MSLSEQWHLLINAIDYKKEELNPPGFFQPIPKFEKHFKNYLVCKW